MNLSEEERDLLALHLVTGIGPRLTAALLERFGSASAALHASVPELLEIPYLGAKVAGDLHKALSNPDVAKECAEIERRGVQLRVLGRAGYPANLGTLVDAPHLLFTRGTLEERDEKAVAIIGSRACTSYGRRLAERIANELALAGWTIISGLARGIDACAHRGALAAKGRTLAVLAGGLSRIYPPEHAELAEQVAASGALVTESCMGMEPMAALFPARNRIISGLSQAVVVIEAAQKSGALITARLAAEQGREVFAVPGPVDSAASAGTLKLLRDGAKLVRNADDILEDLRGLPSLVETRAPEAVSERLALEPSMPDNLDPAQQVIWEALAERQNVDNLGAAVALPMHELTRHLMMMELKKVIRRLPGNWYERT